MIVLPLAIGWALKFLDYTLLVPVKAVQRGVPIKAKVRRKV